MEQELVWMAEVPGEGLQSQLPRGTMVRRDIGQVSCLRIPQCVSHMAMHSKSHIFLEISEEVSSCISLSQYVAKIKGGQEEGKGKESERQSTVTL